jgi:hypothetical protein
MVIVLDPPYGGSPCRLKKVRRGGASSPVVTEMYASLTGIGIAMRTNAFDGDLRDYARWEYGRNDVAWLYAHAAALRRKRRPLLQTLRALVRRGVRLPIPSRRRLNIAPDSRAGSLQVPKT